MTAVVPCLMSSVCIMNCCFCAEFLWHAFYGFFFSIWIPGPLVLICVIWLAAEFIVRNREGFIFLPLYSYHMLCGIWVTQLKSVLSSWWIYHCNVNSCLLFDRKVEMMLYRYACSKVYNGWYIGGLCNQCWG